MLAASPINDMTLLPFERVVTAFHLPRSYLDILSRGTANFLKVPSGPCAGTGDLQGNMNKSRRVTEKLMLMRKALYCRIASQGQHTLLQD